jgi:hypothetical protein
MALPWESAEASREARGGDVMGGRGGDADNEGDSEVNDNDANAGDLQVLVTLQMVVRLLVAQ